MGFSLKQFFKAFRCQSELPKIFLLLDVKNNCTVSLNHLTPRLLAHITLLLLLKHINSV